MAALILIPLGGALVFVAGLLLRLAFARGRHHDRAQ